MFVQDHKAVRRFFLEVWKKHRKSAALEPLESLILGVVLEHPEYHTLLEQEDSLMQDFTPETAGTNPFLHMGLHIAIREQVASNRPAGIKDIYRGLLPGFSSPHDLEHRIMECLGEALWTAQRNNTLPDEAAYLQCLRKLM